MTLFKRITLGVIALAAIILVVGAVAISQLDLNLQKQRIERLVLEKTGRHLQINGEVKARLFPRLGLSLQDVSMGNAVEFTDTDFATVESSELEVEALPLLVGNVKIKSVTLQGLSLKLQRDSDGKTNWDDLMATTAVVATETDSSVVQEVEAGAPVIAALSVGGVSITSSSVSYSDARDASYFVLNELNLSTGTIVLSEPFAFESDFSLISSTGSGLTSVVSAKGEVALDLANNIYRLQQLKLSTVNSGPAVPVEPLALSFNGELVADLNEQSVDVMVADGMISGVPMTGEFHAVGLQDDLRVTGKLASGEFDAGPVIDELGFAADRFIAPELLQRSNVTARFEQTQDALLIEEINVTAGDVELTGDFQIANLSSSGVVSGQLQSNVFNPAPWISSIGLHSGLNPQNRQQSAQISTTVRQSGQLLSFNQLNVQLNDSEISGDIEISDINAANLPITYALSVDQINLDQYVPGDDEAEVVTAGDSVDSHQSLPIDTLRQLDLDGELTFGQVTVGGIRAQNAVIPLLARDGRIELKEAKAELYGGSFFSTVSLDVQSDEPLLTVTGNLNGLNAEPLLQDVLNEAAMITGIANLSVDLLSRGVSRSQLLDGANGALSLRITDGRLSGIDIASELRRAARVLTLGDVLGDVSTQTSGGTSNEISQKIDSVALDKVTLNGVSSVTDFSELSLSAVVADGVLQSDDLVFNSPYLQLSGEGGVNLGSKMLDYLLHVAVTDSALQDDEALQRLVGLELTLPVRGPFNDLSVDLTRLLISAFESDLIGEIKSRLDTGLVTKEREVTDLIESEKEALRLRLEKEQQQAADVIREKKQQVELSAEERKKQLDREKDDLKEKLKDNLKKGLNDLLGEN